ncbi:hypothetical protein D9M71_666810 [compost metagenome]
MPAARCFRRIRILCKSPAVRRLRKVSSRHSRSAVRWSARLTCPRPGIWWCSFRNRYSTGPASSLAWWVALSTCSSKACFTRSSANIFITGGPLPLWRTVIGGCCITLTRKESAKSWARARRWMRPCAAKWGPWPPRTIKAYRCCPVLRRCRMQIGRSWCSNPRNVAWPRWNPSCVT